MVASPSLGYGQHRGRPACTQAFPSTPLERFAYFAKEGRTKLTYDLFATAEVEQRVLSAKGDTRDDEEEARFVELNRLLLLD